MHKASYIFNSDDILTRAGIPTDWRPSWSLLRVFLLSAALLTVGSEVYVRATQWFFDGPRYAYKPLSRTRFAVDTRFVSGVDPVARFLTDTEGLRRPLGSWNKSPNILTLGSSTMECQFLDQEKMFSARVQQSLRDRGLPAEVTMASHSGMVAWNLAQFADAMVPKMRDVRYALAMPGANDMHRWLRGGGPVVTGEMRQSLYVWPSVLTDLGETYQTRERAIQLARSQGRMLLNALHIPLGQGEEAAIGGVSQEAWRQSRNAATKVDVPSDRLASLPSHLAFFRAQLVRLAEACLTRDVEFCFLSQPVAYAEDMTTYAKGLWGSGGLQIPGKNLYLTEASYFNAMERFNDASRQVALDFDGLFVPLSDRIRDANGEYFVDTIHFNNPGAWKAAEILAETLQASIHLPPRAADLTRCRFEFSSSVSPAVTKLIGHACFRESWKGRHRPILVLMPGLTHDASEVCNMLAFGRSQGFFTIAPDMRGRGDSEGKPDIGGLEIWDIVDAVEYVKKHWADYVDADQVVIEGFSGGGGNVLSALTKFPDYWTAGLAWFPISDYGFDPKTGWLRESNSPTLLECIGDPSTPEGRAAYGARASLLGAANNGTARIHLFVDAQDSVCPPQQSRQFVDAARAANLANVQLHESNDGTYAHGYPEWQRLFEAHRVAWPTGYKAFKTASAPAIQDSPQQWTVLGYLKTRKLLCWLGQGNDAAATLRQTKTPKGHVFELEFLTTNPQTWRLELVAAENAPTPKVLVDGRPHESVRAIGAKLLVDNLRGDCRVEVIPANARSD